MGGGSISSSSVQPPDSTLFLCSCLLCSAGSDLILSVFGFVFLFALLFTILAGPSDLIYLNVQNGCGPGALTASTGHLFGLSLAPADAPLLLFCTLSCLCSAAGWG